ncbi:hypothetical protein K3495_g17026, partial [Podosphaera aphanis]
SRAREPDAVVSNETILNTSPFLINALINDSTMVPALVDNGCLCSGIIDDAFASKLKLPRTSISPRGLETAEDSPKKQVVDSITKISLDLDGYVTPNLWLYIVPNSRHRLILGKKWLEDEDAVIHAKDERLELRKTGGSIYNTKRWSQEFESMNLPEVAPVSVIKSMTLSIPVCKASLEDISKALRVKPKLTTEEAR